MAKLAPEAFVLLAIKKLRDPKKSKGIHSVFSGFNAAFRETFPKLDPVKVTTAMAKAGKIETQFVRGGAMLYLPKDAPTNGGKAAEVLKRLGIKG